MKHNQLPPYCPLFLNIRGKKCLVVGGGTVALRKIEALLKHGAQVEIISPVLCPRLNQLVESEAIHWLRRDYQMGDLKDALLAIATTDDVKTNERIAEEARQRKILVNVVDNPQLSDFIVPSYFNRGNIAIAVSTSGRSPALARKLRSQLEREVGIEYAQLTLIVEEVRFELKQQGVSIDSDTWQKALDLDLLIKLVKAGRTQEARNTLFNDLKVHGQSKQ